MRVVGESTTQTKYYALCWNLLVGVDGNDYDNVTV
jgi:hypothetical protein